MTTILYPIMNKTIMRPLSKFGIDRPSGYCILVKSRWVYRRRKRRHCEMIFVVFVLPISVVVEVLKERLVVPAENIFSDVHRLSAVACTASAP